MSAKTGKYMSLPVKRSNRRGYGSFTFCDI